ncbi:MAG TPA: ASKHA domain-containing protein [Candidatus Desulfaltia sp.]|nr:ASKHA domain-containing protein [Candidatus Desulfaltia sp.]
MAHTIKVLSHGRTIPAERKEILADKLRQAGIPLNLYCNKRGLCGKCFVEIVGGRTPDAGERERYWLKERGLGAAHRLSCQFEIDGDLEINVPVSSTHEDVPILPSIPHSVVSPDPAVRKYYLELEKPEISSPDSLFDLILSGLGTKQLKIQPEILRELGRTLEQAGYRATVVVHREKEVVAVEPGTTIGRNFGLAIDVGTTTLVMELVDVESGKSLDLEAALNSQSERGADVISRITYALAGAKNTGELRGLVLETLNQMIRRLLVRNRIPPSSVYEAVVSGNTAMNHLLLGVSLDTLARAPYHAVFSRLPALEADDVGFGIYPRGKVYFAPNIKSFVGGDISSGLLASGLATRPGNYMFIDLGTNGEIVLKAAEELMATSTAAGPAFEGMNISCGLPALPGAVYKAEDAGALRVFTIGNSLPRGVCGTGLIDLTAVYLARGEIAPGGAIRSSAKKLAVADGIVLTQDDVRQMQLACAAIKSGIRLMLKAAGLSAQKLDGIYIAGAFGNYLNIRNTTAIGLLPAVEEGKIVFIGNSSLAGARLLLVAKEERKKIESLVGKIRYISLASDPEFQDQFVRGLEFKSWP